MYLCSINHSANFVAMQPSFPLCQYSMAKQRRPNARAAGAQSAAAQPPKNYAAPPQSVSPKELPAGFSSPTVYTRSSSRLKSKSLGPDSQAKDQFGASRRSSQQHLDFEHEPAHHLDKPKARSARSRAKQAPVFLEAPTVAKEPADGSGGHLPAVKQESEISSEAHEPRNAGVGKKLSFSDSTVGSRDRSAANGAAMVDSSRRPLKRVKTEPVHSAAPLEVQQEHTPAIGSGSDRVFNQWDVAVEDEDREQQMELEEKVDSVAVNEKLVVLNNAAKCKPAGRKKRISAGRIPPAAREEKPTGTSAGLKHSKNCAGSSSKSQKMPKKVEPELESNAAHPLQLTVHSEGTLAAVKPTGAHSVQSLERKDLPGSLFTAGSCDNVVTVETAAGTVTYSGPYPNHSRPFPDECREVTRRLAVLHHFLRIENMSCPSLPPHEHAAQSVAGLENARPLEGQPRKNVDPAVAPALLVPRDGVASQGAGELAVIEAAPTGDLEERRRPIFNGVLGAGSNSVNNEVKAQIVPRGSWGQLSVLDSLIRTMLSQNTTDTNSRRAFQGLKAKFSSWEQVTSTLVCMPISEAASLWSWICHMYADV